MIPKYWKVFHKHVASLQIFMLLSFILLSISFSVNIPIALLSLSRIYQHYYLFYLFLSLYTVYEYMGVFIGLILAKPK